MAMATGSQATRPSITAIRTDKSVVAELRFEWQTIFANYGVKRGQKADRVEP
jgi:hypothetical protein